jgi:uncharacterized membrane protein
VAETKAEDVKDAVEEGGEKITGQDGGANGFKRYVIPAAAGLGTLAATYAARKAPDLVRNKIVPKAEEEAGEEAAKVGKKAIGRMAKESPLGGLAEKALGVGGGKKGGQKKTRRLPIQRWTDIAAPISTVYDKWTEFEEFPKFMHRVLSVQQDDDDEDKVRWEEKIWFSKRQWEGEITERRRNERVAWKTVSGTSHEGVVTFHKLDDKLTRVMVDLDFHPSGLIEKMGSGLRFVKRAAQADLARFKAYVELGEAEGLEYSHDTEAGEKRKKEDEQKKEREKKQKESSGDGRARSQSDGNGSSARSEESDEEDQDQSRGERAERREQRRA